MGRETGLCGHCGSTVRMRAIVHALAVGLFGTPLRIDEFPVRPDVRGVGLSDWHGYAAPLAHRLGYTNTYLHQEPRLDITQIPGAMVGHYDFLITSDVFEHVPPPVDAAFAGAAALLKPGGLLVLTVPYSLDTATLEHYPELHDWRVEQRDGAWIVCNTRRDGTVEEYPTPVFHGGEGQTLEMRVFCERDLLATVAAAGFEDVRVLREGYAAHGIVWPHAWSLPIVARRA